MNDSDKDKDLSLGQGKAGDEGDDWLISYSDMVTLVLCFFIIIVAMSEINPVKFGQVAQSMAGAMGEIDEAEIQISLPELHQKITKVVEDKGLEDKVDVKMTNRGVALNLRGSVLFKLGKATLRQTAKPILSEIAEEINKIPYNIAIEGHTDNIPISSPIFPSNWELSASRASSVVKFFIDKGVPAERLRVVGYSDTRPEVPHNAEDGSSIPENQVKNRRVVVLFLAT